MTNTLRKIHWLVSVQFGINFRLTMESLRGVPRYIRHWLKFRKHYPGTIRFYPCLHDWFEEGGTSKSDYFWQDLYVARKIHAAAPPRHVDVGSRLDGFVAHVAAFREIEVFDIRPITTLIPGIQFRQADLTEPCDAYSDYCESLSCLHALEHFGLGRYGDPIDAQGHLKGLVNMVSMLKPGGTLYLSIPIGIERVEFNAHRIFNPVVFVDIAATTGLTLKDFAWFEPEQNIVVSKDISHDLKCLGERSHNLGIFTFVKQ
jgi:hypothetical protein